MGLAHFPNFIFQREWTNIFVNFWRKTLNGRIPIFSTTVKRPLMLRHNKKSFLFKFVQDKLDGSFAQYTQLMNWAN